MFGRYTHTPKPETLFEPRLVRTSTIAQSYFPTFIRELGTQEHYQETYTFWTHPENIITTQDLEAVYQLGKGEGYRYSTPEEEMGQVSYVG